MIVKENINIITEIFNIKIINTGIHLVKLGIIIMTNT